MNKVYDAVIIGGGFFGMSIANYLKTQLDRKDVLVLEKEADFMQRASLNNQARVHGGYHYPRSLLTGLRSQINFPKFIKEYEEAIVSDFDKYYAVSRNFSKVSGRQFEIFCDRIGAEIEDAPDDVVELFNNNLVERVFKVKEYAFNSDILKKGLIEELQKKRVDLKTCVAVYKVERDGDNLRVVMEDGTSHITKNVFNCTYSSINKINENSKLPIMPLKHELAELSLIELPPELEDKSVTVMCGPFFSFMPFPARKLHTISHVLYTPHSEWADKDGNNRDGLKYLKTIKPISQFRQMINDAQRYLPIISGSKYKDSIWEIKTVLQQSEQDDSRPILFRQNNGLKGYHCIMGAKLDNIYDVFRELDLMYDQN
jgi:glycine/D-amino acid oxidase-like deaminating enzyme